MKSFTIILLVLVLSACSAVRVTNTDANPVPTKIKNTPAEPVPVEIIGQPVKTTITNDLSNIKVNNKDNEPIPVKIVNGQGNGNNVENKIYFRIQIEAVTTLDGTFPIEIKNENLISGTLPTEPYNYIITSILTPGENVAMGITIPGKTRKINYFSNMYLPVPFNSSEKIKIDLPYSLTVIGYILN